MIIPINLKTNPYKIYINEEINTEEEIVILTNTTVSKLYLSNLLEKLGKTPKLIITINDGEEYKNLETLDYILNQLSCAKISRNATLINLGGGVITDIGGFAASIYKRGIKHINIATTLLASVDAAVGGKTGINNQYGKNLIGTFKQPEAVYIFTDYFNTLSTREISAAMAEVIKMALCFDLDFYNFLKENSISNVLDNIIIILEKSIKMKANVVINDELEKNERMKLNYGHTFAHVVENFTNYKTYLHGEAVAIGMIMANELAYKLNLISNDFKEDIINTLEKYNLKIRYKIQNTNDFYEAFFNDKKNTQSLINFILLDKNDKCIIKNDVNKNIIMQTLEEFK